MVFVTQIFQDIDGAYSAKRTAFFVFVFLFVIVTLGIHFYRDEASFLNSALDKITDVIKWLGGFIVAEQGTKFARKDA